MTVETIGARIQRARETSGKSQRAIQADTGISQSRLSRIESGDHAPKLNEVLALSWTLGYTVTELTGHSPVRDRAQFAARTEMGGDVAALQAELIHFLELDAFLDEQGVARPE